MGGYTIYAADGGTVFVEDIDAPTREEAERAALARLCEAFGYELEEFASLDDLPCYALNLDERGPSPADAAPDMLAALEAFAAAYCPADGAPMRMEALNEAYAAALAAIEKAGEA